jgi:LmbE family N-acetylglucosaminyl deacetylase
MNFINDSAQLFIPDGLAAKEALARTTHLAIGAHPDDLEIMAIDGILTCFQQPDRWFSGVVVTDGRGSAREGVYESYSDDDMRQVRIGEQKKAATVGEYAAVALLDYRSSDVRDPENEGLARDLAQVLLATRPQIVYTHNLADKHETHVGVALQAIKAIRSLPAGARPKRLYGCEVWRDLDWMLDTDKVLFDCSAHENLQAALLGTFDSQIAGGKRYDLAAMGRRKANATYFASHETDEATGLVFAMDLTPLIQDPDLDIGSYVQSFVDGFGSTVAQWLRDLQGR